MRSTGWARSCSRAGRGWGRRWPTSSAGAWRRGCRRGAGAVPLEDEHARPRSVAELFAELEFDRYDDLTLFARSVSEIASDIAEVHTELASLGRSVREDVGLVHRLTGEVRAGLGRARLVPIGSLYTRFARQGQEAARAASKSVRIETSGESVELDASVIEQIVDPLLHLAQNAVAHGIENPDERQAAGKPAAGVVSLTASHRGAFVVVEVADDGRGIDVDRLRQRAVAQGFVTSEVAAAMSDKDALDLIFRPGFSTAAEVTTTAGRGVGMDIVRTNVGRLNGEVEVSTEPGVGTRFSLRLPLTVLVTEALLVRAAGEALAVPVNAVHVIATLGPSERRITEDGEAALIEDRWLPMVRLDRALGLPEPGAAERLQVLALRGGGGLFACAVDQVLHKEEIVVKPLGAFLDGVGPYAGATVAADGRVTLAARSRASRRARHAAGPAEPRARMATPAASLGTDGHGEAGDAAHHGRRARKGAGAAGGRLDQRAEVRGADAGEGGVRGGHGGRWRGGHGAARRARLRRAGDRPRDAATQRVRAAGGRAPSRGDARSAGRHPHDAIRREASTPRAPARRQPLHHQARHRGRLRATGRVAGAAERDGAHTVKVLIVDPDPHRAPALAQALVTGGAEVTVAPNGSFALTMLEWNRHDVVISRALIDDMGGHELCAILKADPSTREVRFVLVASADEVSGVESAAGGVDLVLPPGMTGSAIVPLVVRLMRGDRTPVVPPEPPRPAPIAAAPVTKVTPPPPMPRPPSPAPARPLAGGSEPAPGAASPERGRAAQAVRDRGGGQRPLDVEDDAGHRIGGRPAPRRRPDLLAVPSGMFQGSLEVMDLAELTQAIGVGGKSGRLILALGRGSGLIVFDAGRVVHAEYRNAVGEEAFSALLTAAHGDGGGRFCFVPATGGTPARPRTIDKSVDQLLLSTATAIDEKG